jgi:SulP family sulfate permease
MRRVIGPVFAMLPRRSDYAGVGRSWRRDLLAGITVGIVALPLALGFGISSGAGATAGIVTAIVAGVIAAVFGGSNVQVSGPTGAMVVVLAPVIATHGIESLWLLTAMAGILVLVAGILRLGRAVAFIPVACGRRIHPRYRSHHLPPTDPSPHRLPVPHLGAHQRRRHRCALPGHGKPVLPSVGDPSYLLWATTMVAVVAACMLLLPRMHPAIPGSLIAIVLVTLICVVIPNPLDQVGALPTALPVPQLPVFDAGSVTALAHRSTLLIRGPRFSQSLLRRDAAVGSTMVNR